MTTTLITACEGIPSETDQVVVSPAAVPFLLAAGWVRRDQSLHDALAHTPPPFVPVIEDVA